VLVKKNYSLNVFCFYVLVYSFEYLNVRYATQMEMYDTAGQISSCATIGILVGLVYTAA
jgi:hypothetical protein